MSPSLLAKHPGRVRGHTWAGSWLQALSQSLPLSQSHVPSPASLPGPLPLPGPCLTWTAAAVQQCSLQRPLGYKPGCSLTLSGTPRALHSLLGPPLYLGWVSWVSPLALRESPHHLLGLTVSSSQTRPLGSLGFWLGSPDSPQVPSGTCSFSGQCGGCDGLPWHVCAPCYQRDRDL